MPTKPSAFRLPFLLAALFGLAAPGAFAASEDAANLNGRVDFVWTAVAAALVLLMQVGFMLLEAGLVRSKNSVNVAQKNLTDFAFSAVAFALIGFSIMFGPSIGGWLGDPTTFAGLADLDGAAMTFFLFQAMFVGTAATIMSGAVAERFSYAAYLATIPLVSIVIYPVFGHWAWGDLLLDDGTAWLADMGFVDFAGSTVVHAVGGAVALAGAIAVGPRRDRYGPDGRPVRLHGHSALLATVGAFLLFVGWLGFNGGSMAGGFDAGPVLAATVLAGSAGCCVASIAGYAIDGHFHPSRAINGLLGGLVGVTAGAHLLDMDAAMAIGAIGGLVALAADDLLARAGVDDPVGAVAVHGFAGVWGTVGLALLAPEASLPTGDRLSQLGVQAYGAGIAVVWAFSLTYAWLMMLKVVVRIRVSEEDEFVGLNAAEHDTLMGTGEVQAMLRKLVESDLDGVQQITVQPGDESSELAELFNRLIANVRANDERRRMMAEQMQIGAKRQAAEDKRNIEAWRAERDLERAIVDEISDVVSRMANGDLDRRATLTRQTENLSAIGGAVNALLDHVAGMTRSVTEGARRLQTHGAAQLDAAESLARDSLSQEAAVGEATADLRRLSGEIGQTAEAARATRETAASTLRSAESGGAAIESAVVTMQTIRAKSQRIIAVIDMINEIANQTNLLAINAAVEAARAGEQGRGFAVVASEVRTLSQRTQQMADEISASVRESEAAIREGVAVVSETTEALAEIRASAARTENNMASIDDAARLQADSVRALLDAIERIDALGRRTRNVATQTEETARTLSTETSALADAASLYTARKNMASDAA